MNTCLCTGGHCQPIYGNGSILFQSRQRNTVRGTDSICSYCAMVLLNCVITKQHGKTYVTFDDKLDGGRKTICRGTTTCLLKSGVPMQYRIHPRATQERAQFIYNTALNLTHTSTSKRCVSCETTRVYAEDAYCK